MPNKDKIKQRESARRHYERNREKMKARAILCNTTARKRNRTFVLEHLLSHPCVDCGESDPIVLDFDHVFGIKRSDISNMVHSCVSIKTLSEEMAKCVIRCANCHRRKTRMRSREAAISPAS